MTGPDEREFFDHLQAGAPRTPPEREEPQPAPPVEETEAAPETVQDTAGTAPAATSVPWPPRAPGHGAHAADSAAQRPGPRWVPSTPPGAYPGSRPGDTDPGAGPVVTSGPISTPTSGPIARPESGPDSGPPGRATLGPDTDLAQPAEPRWGAPAEGATTWELMRDQLRASNLTPVRKIPPSRGWRRLLYKASLGRINPGESPDETRLRSLKATVDTPLRGTYSVVVLGGKGGAGKTTVTAAIGSLLAQLRNDKVVAIDADPAQAANLASRIDPRASSSFGEVLADAQLARYSDMRSHVGQNPAGLDVLAASPQAGRGPIDATTYTEAHGRLERFYSVLLADSGVDLQHPVTAGMLGCADTVVLVASAVPDGAEGAAKVMDWLSEMGYRHLTSRMLVVINQIRPYFGRRDQRQSRQLVATLVERFGDWVGPDEVFVLPFDPHIASAAVLDLDQLRPRTRRRFLEITATLASEFAATTEGRR